MSTDIDDEEWDEESVDGDLEDPDEDSEGGSQLSGSSGQMTVADIEVNDSHEVVRTNRTINMEFVISVGVEVIEPPRVFDAEIQQQMKRKLRDAVTSYHSGQLGTVTHFAIEAARPSEEE